MRWVEVSVTAESDGGTLLRAKSQSQWIVTRPVGERIPVGVREVDVLRRPPERTAGLRRVTTRAKVHALVALFDSLPLVALFDSLPLVQPAVIGCPLLRAAPTVVVEFRGGATDAVLARASASAAAAATFPDTLPGWACYPVTFRAYGRGWPDLAGGVITPMRRLLQVKLG